MCANEQADTKCRCACTLACSHIKGHTQTHTQMCVFTYAHGYACTDTNVCVGISKANFTWPDNKVRELIAVKVLHTSLLNTTMVAFKVLPLGSYALIPAPSPPFKTILELVLWNGLQSYCCITPDVINIIKMPSFQYFLDLREQKKIIGV